MSLLFQGFVQFFVWIILRYFDVLINICEVSDLFHIVFEISVKDQNFSLTLLCTYVSTDTPIFVLDLEQSSSSIYKKNLTIFGKNPNGGGRDRSRDLSDQPI